MNQKRSSKRKRFRLGGSKARIAKSAGAVEYKDWFSAER